MTAVSPKRIALLSTFHPYRGGIAQFGARLYRELESAGHEVRAWNFKRQYPSVLFPGKTQLVPEGDLADAIPNERTLDSIGPLSWFNTGNAIQAWEPDVLVMKYWMPFLAPALGTAARRVKSARKVVSLDNVTPHEPRPGDRQLNRYFLNSCDAFMAMSQAVADDVKGFRPNAPLQVQPHPVYDHFALAPPKAAACQQLGLDPDLPVFLFFGFIRDYKGLDVLLEATAQLERPVQVLIAGEVYGAFDRYQALIDAHPHKAHIHLYNRYIADAEVPPFFGAADACVLPYRSATQSGIAAIALQLGTPMISTRIGGLHEYIADGVDGMLVPAADPNALAGAMHTYLDQGLSTPFRHALATKREAFSWRAYCNSLLSL